MSNTSVTATAAPTTTTTAAIAPYTTTTLVRAVGFPMRTPIATVVSPVIVPSIYQAVFPHGHQIFESTPAGTQVMYWTAPSPPVPVLNPQTGPPIYINLFRDDSTLLFVAMIAEDLRIPPWDIYHQLLNQRFNLVGQGYSVPWDISTFNIQYKYPRLTVSRPERRYGCTLCYHITGQTWDRKGRGRSARAATQVCVQKHVEDKHPGLNWESCVLDVDDKVMRTRSVPPKA